MAQFESRKSLILKRPEGIASLRFPGLHFFSMAGTSQSRAACARKVALMEDLQKSMVEIMAIHESEVACLVAGDFGDSPDLNVRLEAARKKKDSLIELYKEHVTSHGC